jgi:hypothetical protein
MKTLLLLLLLTGKSYCTDPTDVYICDSPGAAKYHLRQDCKGLRNCRHRVIKITLEEAKRKGRTLCALEK